MRYFTSFLLLLLTMVNGQNEVCKVTPANNCVTFSVNLILANSKIKFFCPFLAKL